MPCNGMKDPNAWHLIITIILEYYLLSLNL